MDKKKQDKKEKTKKVDFSAFYQRNNDLVRQKAQLYDNEKEKQIAHQRQEKKQIYQINYYHPNPFIAHKTKYEIWDDDGYLIINRNSTKQKRDMNTHSSYQTKRHQESNYNQYKRKRELNSSLTNYQNKNNEEIRNQHHNNSQKEKDFALFLKRQEKSAQMKIKKYPLPAQKSLMCQNSIRIANKVYKQKNKQYKSQIDSETFNEKEKSDLKDTIDDQESTIEQLNHQLHDLINQNQKENELMLIINDLKKKNFELENENKKLEESIKQTDSATTAENEELNE